MNNNLSECKVLDYMPNCQKKQIILLLESKCYHDQYRHRYMNGELRTERVLHSMMLDFVPEHAVLSCFSFHSMQLVICSNEYKQSNKQSFTSNTLKH